MTNIDIIKELTNKLNSYRNDYYNNSKSMISDYEYDNLFDRLKNLEEETGLIMSNSPTKTVGYEVKSKLEKRIHSHPMLSLDKTKSVDELIEFAGDKDCLLMHKMDGLTVLLTYENGQLAFAETRGNGEEGEIITHNARVFNNIPLTIPYKEHFEIEGEAIITYDEFEQINAELSDENKYKNPRNLVSGSVRQLDSKIAEKRNIKFIGWKIPNSIKAKWLPTSMLGRLKYANEIGFNVVHFWTYTNNSSDKENINAIIGNLKHQADKLGYPIDGLVMSYDDIEYGELLGTTGHHPRHSIAYKFYDEEVSTILREIEWSMGKTGDLTPVAIFDPCELEGTTVERASLHNVSICIDLKLGIGDEITVYKANQIIPQVRENLTKSGSLVIPDICPVCGSKTEIMKENDTEVLRCINPNCKGKLLGRLSHAVSKNALNIDGFSEATIEKFIRLGWLKSLKDIYHLEKYSEEMISLDGFGKKSVEKLFAAIQTSRHVKLQNFIYSLSIPMIGKTASKTISKYFDYHFDKFIEAWSCGFGFDWTILNDFGSVMHTSMSRFYLEHGDEIKEFAKDFTFESETVVITDNIKDLSGKTFVITGSLSIFANRDEAKEEIERLGGKVSGSVSKNTFALVNNDIESKSGKNKKAKELGIQIITENQLLQMIR